MPGFLLHFGATVACVHAGQAVAGQPFPRVRLGGQPVTTVASQYTVACCAFNVSGVPSPCASAQWTTSALRIKAGGQPVLLHDSQASCMPNGTGVLVGAVQARVKGM